MATPTNINEACRRMKTAIATETGNIVGASERFLAESNDYSVNRIPAGQFDPSEGVDPVTVRYSSAPVQDTKYTDLLVSGEQDGTMSTTGCDGQPAELAANYNKRGAAGCNLAAEKIVGGYDTYSHRLKGKAWETDIVCAMDLYLRKHYQSYLRMLRTDLPKRAKEQFARALNADVVENSLYNCSAVNGLVTQAGAFPVAPTNTLEIGLVRRLAKILKAQGWTGKFEIAVSQEAFETMRLNYKKNTGQELQTTVVSNDTHHLGMDTTVVDYADIRFVIVDQPVRGYLKENGDGTTTFVEVLPTKARQGTGQGIVADVNEDYFRCHTVCDGKAYEVFEVGFYIHPNAAQRKAFAAPPADDKRFSGGLFNFEVKMIDGAFIDCNYDEFKFFHRVMHAYSFAPQNPELMGGLIYRVQPDIIYGNIPVCDDGCDVTGQEVDYGRPPEPRKSECDSCDCTSGESIPYEPAVPVATQDEPCPVPNEGIIKLASCGEVLVKQGQSVFISAERVGGTLGAATVTASTANGTATAGTDYTAVSGEVLSWADEEGGHKYVEVVIAPTGTGTLTLTIASATGATLADGSTNGCTSVTLVIQECPATTTTAA